MDQSCFGLLRLPNGLYNVMFLMLAKLYVKCTKKLKLYLKLSHSKMSFVVAKQN